VARHQRVIRAARFAFSCCRCVLQHPHRGPLKNQTSRIQAIDPRWEDGWAGHRCKGWPAATAFGG
jgi:hypothetical protein